MNLKSTKLSELQKFILKAAVCTLWNQTNLEKWPSTRRMRISEESRQKVRFYLRADEILIGFFGFKECRKITQRMKPAHSAARASIFGACKRLEQRRLIEFRSGSINLTQTGRDLAQRLALPWLV